MPTILAAGLWKPTRCWVHTGVRSRCLVPICAQLCAQSSRECASTSGSHCSNRCWTHCCVCTIVLSPSISFFLSWNDNQGMPSPAQSTILLEEEVYGSSEVVWADIWPYLQCGLDQRFPSAGRYKDQGLFLTKLSSVQSKMRTKKIVMSYS